MYITYHLMVPFGQSHFYDPDDLFNVSVHKILYFWILSMFWKKGIAKEESVLDFDSQTLSTTKIENHITYIVLQRAKRLRDKCMKVVIFLHVFVF